MTADASQEQSLDALRDDVVRVGRLLYEKNLAIASDGNISVRLGDGRLLTTPSGMCKGLLTADSLVVTNAAGKLVEGSGKPSSELRLHLAVYRERPDVGAVVHAHPPVATAFTLAGLSLADALIPEVVFTMGSIPTAEYATPASADGARVIAPVIRQHDAVLLDRHGAVTCGPDLWDAFKKMEKVEHAATTVMYARMLGGPRPLPAKEIDRLVAIHDRMGLPGPCTVLRDESERDDT